MSDPNSSPAAVASLPSPLTSTRHWGRSLAFLVAWVVLLLGVAGSVLGGRLWANYQIGQSERILKAAAKTDAGTIQAALQRELDFEASISALIAAFPDLTNAQLANWVTPLKLAHRFPGTLGFGFIVPVSAAQLNSFITTMNADPVVGYQGPYVVSPPGIRPQYCLIRLGVTRPGDPVPANADVCAPAPGSTVSVIANMYERIAASGDMVVLSGSQVLSPSISGALRVADGHRSLLKDLFTLTAPVYQGGAIPSTSAAREASFRGWLVQDFSAKALLAPIVKANPADRVKVQTSSGVLLAQAGKIPHGDTFSYTKLISADPAVSVTVERGRGSVGVLEGVLLGVIGGILSVVLFSFLLHITRSRSRALALVEERTEELRHRALHDALTGLPNRVLLLDRADQMLARARRLPLEVGALYVDLDHFKDVNDSFGHPFGDRLLRSVADRLASALRESDTVGRLGGDEFLVLVEADTLDSSPVQVAQRLLDALREPFCFGPPDDLSLRVRASIGVVVGGRPSAEELIRDADIALYEAKAAGRHRAVVFLPEMHLAAQDRVAVEMDLRRGVGVVAASSPSSDHPA